MPGMRVVAHRGVMTPRQANKPVGVSLTYRVGDLLCLAGSSPPTLRLLATADATALYETAASDIVGLYGVCTDAAVSNASNVITSRPDAITRAAGVAVPPRTPSVGSTLPADSSAKSQLNVDIVDEETWIGGVLLETTTVTEALIDTQVGLDMTVTSGVTAFKWSTAAAVKIGRIVDVNRTDPKFNVSGGGGEVFVTLYPAYMQFRNGFNYAS